MKSTLHACWLLSLQWLAPAQAYEADIHYSTTYVLARAIGWSNADARTIASANEAVDENRATVAALEMEAIPDPSFAGFVTSSLRQAEKNLAFHCFSRSHGQAGRISADVLEVISGHFAEVREHSEDPRANTRRLIALGVALHCQQDAHAHVGFGGSCGTYPGSCYGHSHENFLDHMVFRILGKHHFNPDHPGVSGERLLEALQGTVSELAARRPKTSLRSIPTRDLVALSDALRASGLELPDDVRRECNRHLAGKWLFDFFRSSRRTQAIAAKTQTLGPDVAVICKNASLTSATVVSIPEPRFPRLNADASPLRVSADGAYEVVDAGDSDVSMPGIHVAEAGRLPNYKNRRVKVQLSHWSQVFALPHLHHR